MLKSVESRSDVFLFFFEMEPRGCKAAVPSIPALHPRANARGLRAEADKVQPSQLNFCLNFPAVAKIFRQLQLTTRAFFIFISLLPPL